MKKIEISRMEVIEGGSFWGGFCDGVNAATAVYGAGVLANLWNPVGQTATVALAVVNVACIFS